MKGKMPMWAGAAHPASPGWLKVLLQLIHIFYEYAQTVQVPGNERTGIKIVSGFNSSTFRQIFRAYCKYQQVAGIGWAVPHSQSGNVLPLAASLACHVARAACRWDELKHKFQRAIPIGHARVHTSFPCCWRKETSSWENVEAETPFTRLFSSRLRCSASARHKAYVANCS